MTVLLPVAPILLLPFIVLFFAIVFPFWMVAVALLGVLLGTARGVDALLGALKLQARVAPPVSRAFHWTLSWGGIADRRDKPKAP